MREMKRSLSFAFLAACMSSLVLPSAVAAQATDGSRIAVHVFASDQSSSDAVAVQFSTAPATGPNHGWNGLFRFDARRGHQQAEALRGQLERSSVLQHLVRHVDVQEDADLLLEVVATGYSEPRNPLRRQIVVVRLSVGPQPSPVDFLGQRVDALRTETYLVARQIEEWVEVNHATLQRLTSE